MSRIASARLTYGPLLVDLDVRLAEGQSPAVKTLTLTMTGDDLSIDKALLKQLPARIDEWADYVAAYALAQEYGLGTGKLVLDPFGEGIKVGDMKLDVDPDALYAGFQKGRKAHRPDSDYLAVARIYKDADAQGLSVRKAVADHFHVGMDRASQLIAGARERGLLPPANRKPRKKGKR